MGNGPITPLGNRLFTPLRNCSLSLLRFFPLARFPDWVNAFLLSCPFGHLRKCSFIQLRKLAVSGQGDALPFVKLLTQPKKREVLIACGFLVRRPVTVLTLKHVLVPAGRDFMKPLKGGG